VTSSGFVGRGPRLSRVAAFYCACQLHEASPLALESVDGTDSNTVGHLFRDAADGEVVGRDDHDVLGLQGLDDSSFIGDGAPIEQISACSRDRVSFLV
jgi:hypothetical protein